MMLVLSKKTTESQIKGQKDLTDLSDLTYSLQLIAGLMSIKRAGRLLNFRRKSQN